LNNGDIPKVLIESN